MTHSLTVGFIPLLDCAALVAAQARGFAAEEGLELILVRETSWANIRDRLIVGHFDAAHMLGPMAVASTLGIGHLTEAMVAPISLGLGGNAITVSGSLWSDLQLEGAKPGGDPALQGAALRRVLAARNRSQLPPLTFGMVYPFSCHNYELRYWLAAVGIDPDRDVRLVVIPPPLLADAMRAGQIDGFCVGEPWNSVAVEAGIGAILTPTSAIWPSSPEKVLGCREAWAERHPEQLAALVRAIYRAARWCEDRDNHPEVARLLADARYVGATAQMLHQALVNRLPLIRGADPHPMPDFFALARDGATFPWTSHAVWYYSQMVRWRQVEHSDDKLAAARATYRPDLYRNALAQLSADVPPGDTKTDRFFDGRMFDPADLAAFFL